MSTRSLIQISDTDYTTLKNLANKFSGKFNFFVFGSRVKGTAKKYSDIDIAYEKLGDHSISLFRDQLESSNLSITVDLVDLDEIDDDFQRLIRSEMIPLLEK